MVDRGGHQSRSMRPARRDPGPQIRRIAGLPGQWGLGRGRGELALIARQPREAGVQRQGVSLHRGLPGGAGVQARHVEAAGVDIAQIDDRPVGVDRVGRQARRVGIGHRRQHLGPIGRVGRGAEECAERGELRRGQGLGQHHRRADPVLEGGAVGRKAQGQVGDGVGREGDAGRPRPGGLRPQVWIAALIDEAWHLAPLGADRDRRDRIGNIELRQGRGPERGSVAGLERQARAQDPDEPDLGIGGGPDVVIVLDPPSQRQLQALDPRQGVVWTHQRRVEFGVGAAHLAAVAGRGLVEGRIARQEPRPAGTQRLAAQLAADRQAHQAARQAQQRAVKAKIDRSAFAADLGEVPARQDEVQHRGLIGPLPDIRIEIAVARGAKAGQRAVGGKARRLGEVGAVDLAGAAADPQLLGVAAMQLRVPAGAEPRLAPQAQAKTFGLAPVAHPGGFVLERIGDAFGGLARRRDKVGIGGGQDDGGGRCGVMGVDLAMGKTQVAAQRHQA